MSPFETLELCKCLCSLFFGLSFPWGFSYSVRLCILGGGEANGLGVGVNESRTDSTARENLEHLCRLGGGLLSPERSAWSRLYTVLQTVIPQHWESFGGWWSPEEGICRSLSPLDFLRVSKAWGFCQLWFHSWVSWSSYRSEAVRPAWGNAGRKFPQPLFLFYSSTVLLSLPTAKVNIYLSKECPGHSTSSLIQFLCLDMLFNTRCSKCGPRTSTLPAWGRF